MKTLRQELNIRKIDCHVTTTKNWYAGIPRDLLEILDNEELNELVISKTLSTCTNSDGGTEKQWELRTIE